MNIEKKIKFNMSVLNQIVTTKHLYGILGITKGTEARTVNLKHVYASEQQNKDILDVVLANAKKNKNDYKVKWKYLKQSLINEWTMYAPNTDKTLNIPYGEIWLAEGWNWQE